MKKTLLMALAATTVLGTSALADDITEFRIGILGGENAQDRLTNNQCLADKVSEAIGVPVKMFAPADYNGVIQGIFFDTGKDTIKSTSEAVLDNVAADNSDFASILEHSVRATHRRGMFFLISDFVGAPRGPEAPWIVPNACRTSRSSATRSRRRACPSPRPPARHGPTRS